MKTKVVACLTALALIFSGGGITVFADEQAPSGAGAVVAEAPTSNNEATLGLKGNGTKTDPYQVSTADDLMKLAAFVNAGNNESGKYFKQTMDIDLSGKTWEPISYSDTTYYFAGTYDGGNHTISNAKSDGKNDSDGQATVGIFGCVKNGEIKNLQVKNANFKATGKNAYAHAGGICGIAYGSKITNCSVTDSKLDAKRDLNAVAAGGVAGYSTGGQFEKCASINNTVTATSYAGGFVGEIDNDYAGDSHFENCYVTGGSVTVCSKKSQDLNYAGGFVGEVTEDTLIAKNCYVFKENILIDPETAVPNAKSAGVFAGNLNNGSLTIDSSYYGACGEVTNNVGNATSKTDVEFSDGTVAELLGDAFMQGTAYPVLKSQPADYTAVDAAIAAANALNKEDYIDFSAVTSAINAVNRGKTIVDQGEVDAMAQAINGAIDALQKKTTSTPTTPTTPSTPSAPTQPSRPSYNGPSYTTPTTTPTATPTTTPTTIKFTDVPTSAYYRNALEWALQKNYVFGKTSTSFDPSGISTRGQLVTVLYRITGSPKVSGTSAFGDVNQGSYYHDAVLWAERKGIVFGMGDNQFKPNAKCTRAQFVVMLYRLYGHKTSGDAPFTDVTENDYFHDAVLWAYQNGVISGTSATTFSPNRSCSRAEMVQILYNMRNML